MGVCGCVIPNPNCHCHFTPVSDWQYNNSTNHLVTMPKDVLDQIGKEHTEEVEGLRQQNALLLGALNQMVRHHDQLTPEDIKQAKDAIAKATGGE